MSVHGGSHSVSRRLDLHDSIESGTADSDSEGQFRAGDSGQSALATFNTDSQDDDDAHQARDRDTWTTDEPLTLVFATTTRSWRFLKEIAPGSNPDDSTIAEQELWHLLAVDEASMLELPNFLLAGLRGLTSLSQ